MPHLVSIDKHNKRFREVYSWQRSLMSPRALSLNGRNIMRGHYSEPPLVSAKPGAVHSVTLDGMSTRVDQLLEITFVENVRCRPFRSQLEKRLTTQI